MLTDGRLGSSLIELGHTQLATITGPLHLTNAQERLNGFRQAVKGAGLQLEPEYVQEATFDKQGPTQFSIASAIRKRNIREPTSINQLPSVLVISHQLSLHDIEELLFERSVIVTYETVLCWSDKLGAGFAHRVKSERRKPGSTWYLDKVFVTLCGEPNLPWRAVDEHGAELDILLQKRRDKTAAKRMGELRPATRNPPAFSARLSSGRWPAACERSQGWT